MVSDSVASRIPLHKVSEMTSPHETVFSDEDKEALVTAINYNNSMQSYFESPIKNQTLLALLARLEAAERVCTHIRDNGFPKDLRDRAYDYMNEWRKAAGK